MTSAIASLPLPPGNLGLPLIGETLNFLRERDFVKKRKQRYGSIFKSHIFGRPTIFIVGAEANRFILMNENKYFRATWPPSTKILLGQHSLAVKTGAFHSSRRRLMYMAFQPRVLASYIPKMSAITDDYLQKWENLETLTWYPELRRYTFDVACNLLIGENQGSDDKLAQWFEEWCAGLFSLPIKLPWTRFQKALHRRSQLLQEIEKIVIQRQKEEKYGNNALDILLQAEDDAGNRLSLEELNDQILLLLFAGHETLTSAIASFCLLTAQNSEIVDQLRQEQQEFSSDSLSLENLQKMTYLEQVLKEVLRLIPPVGGVFREIVAECEYDGYRLPQGWGVQCPILATHEEETLYPNPKQFDPARFSGENAVDKGSGLPYLPFGGGMRECLGKEFAKLEMKLFAVKLLRNYDWTLLPDQDLTLAAIPTPKPRDGLKVQLTRLGKM